MRAAQLDSKNVVLNFVEVAGFGGVYVDPLNSNLGDSIINGIVIPKVTPPEVIKAMRTAKIIEELDSIERNSLENRGEREFHILQIEMLAAQEAQQNGTTIEQILAASPYYKKLTEINNQCRALRSELASL